MIGFDEAVALIQQSAGILGVETLPLAAASGRILAEPVTARSDAPRRAVSAMDGYAVCDATTAPGARLTVIGESWAGAGFSGPVASGEAVRIFTGAPMPDGTDRCIMQEYAAREGDMVSFSAGYGPGRHVRAAASDFAAGSVLLGAGVRLTPQAMIAAAAADRAALSAARQPDVAMIATGDELYPPGEAYRRPDGIAESVTYGVAAMAQHYGAQIVMRERGADDLGSLQDLAGRALDLADVVIVTGGASVGERDFAKSMFTPHGLELIFAKVAIKPGKPVWLGRARGKWVIGLPGNPTSAMVTARLFLVPLLWALLGGAADAALSWRTLPLAGPLAATGPRETFVRAQWSEAGLVPLSNQDSGAQAALASAGWLIRCLPDQAQQEVGAPVAALRLL